MQPPYTQNVQVNQLMEQLGLPEPFHVERCDFEATLNEVYILYCNPDPSLAPAEAKGADGEVVLYLRLNIPINQHLVATEFATIKYVALNTTIPVPVVLRYDDTTNNVFGRQFTLLVKTGGFPVAMLCNREKLEEPGRAPGSHR